MMVQNEKPQKTPADPQPKNIQKAAEPEKPQTATAEPQPKSVQRVAEPEKPQESTAEPQPEGVPEAAETDIDLRSSQANNIIKNHVIGVMGASLVPIPLFDLVALTGVQIKMLHSLTKLYEVPFSKNLGKSLIVSLLGGIMPTSAAMTLASLAKTVPGLGTATGMISVSVLGGATTYAIGSVFMQHFESGGTLLDFDPKKMREYFASKLEEGKEVAAKLKPSKAP